MASGAEWARAYARQAQADLTTFDALQNMPVPDCHKLQFLHMACEKLVKAHLCGIGTDPTSLQKSHAYVAGTLPVVLRQYMMFVSLKGLSRSRATKRVKHLCQEIDVLAPAVKRGGHRHDNCEYPWTDAKGKLHVPLDWTFYPSQLLLDRSGRSFLKLIRGAINRLLTKDD